MFLKDYFIWTHSKLTSP